MSEIANEGGRAGRVKGRPPGGNGEASWHVSAQLAPSGAGDENRTRMASLEGWCSTIELRPRGTGDFECPLDSWSRRGQDYSLRSRGRTHLSGVPSLVRHTGCSAAWLARMLWEHEAAGSNPATPTKPPWQRLRPRAVAPCLSALDLVRSAGNCKSQPVAGHPSWMRSSRPRGCARAFRRCVWCACGPTRTPAGKPRSTAP